MVFTLLAAAIMASIYYNSRFGGWSMEVDTAQQSVAADGIVATGSLEHNHSYNNGYGYGALLAFLSYLSGQSIQSIQLFLAGSAVIVVLAAFLVYRELLESSAIAFLAAILLLMQPDFMFYVLRGSHESVTWTLLLLMVFLLLRGSDYRERPSRFVFFVLAFYLLCWAMVAVNVYFSSSVLSAFALALVGGWLIKKMIKNQRVDKEGTPDVLRRLVFIVSIGWLLVFLFITYIYEPGILYYYTFSEMVDRIGILFFGAQPLGQPISYSYYENAWQSRVAYLSLTGLQWIFVVSSFITWLIGLRQIKSLAGKRLLLWLFYSSFGVLLVIGVVVDFAGFLNTNLQLRLFTPFVLFASPMAALLCAHLFERLCNQSRRRILLPVCAVIVAWGLLASALKTTNDPILGNHWFFYHDGELKAANWIEEHIQYQRIWVDTRPHLAETFHFWQGYEGLSTNKYEFKKNVWSPPTYTLITALTKLRSDRVGEILPATNDKNLIYDNEEAQLFHRRPETSFQK